MLSPAHFYGLPLLSRRIHSSRQINRGVVIRGTISIAGFSDRVSNAGYPQTVQSNHKVRAVPARSCPGRAPTRHRPQKSFLGLLSSAHFQNFKNPFPLFSLFQFFRKNIFSANCAGDNNCTSLLLFTAQFQNGRLRPAKSSVICNSCYLAHILVGESSFCAQTGLLSPAYCCFRHKSVVIPGTMYLLFCAHFGCYRRHSFTLYLNKKAKSVKR